MFKGRYVVVTGGSGGIGKETAMLLAKKGVSGIIIADLNEDAAKTAAKEIEKAYETEAYGVKTDVGDEVSVKALFDTAVEKFKKVDILINCAGICPRTPLAEETTEKWDRVMRVNITGVHLCCREALAIMKRNHYGRIVTISSIAAHVGTSISAVSYAASKAAIHGASRSYAKLGVKDNITVNMVCPSVVDSEMSSDLEYDVETLPMGRLALPSDVAPAIVFLASDDASYITGVALDINGGTYFA